MRRPAAFVLVLATVLAVGRSGPAAAADPFYESLMETGISAHARGDHATAAEDLRLASFGLLEEPEKLAECLTYLALAQAGVADVAAFTHTIDRLLEVERRFEAFSNLALDAGLRQALEGHLLAWIPFEVLDRSEVFRRVGRRKRQIEIRDMPPAERRQELALRLAAEPDFAPWRLLLAELDFAEGDFAAARSAAELLLQQSPEMTRARCLRGRAGAALGWCEQALADVEACDEPFAAGLLEERLRCHLALQDFDGASAVLAQVSADDRQRQPFRQLARDVDRGRRAAARAQAAAQKEEAGRQAAPAAAAATGGEGASAGEAREAEAEGGGEPAAFIPVPAPGDEPPEPIPTPGPPTTAAPAPVPVPESPVPAPAENPAPPPVAIVPAPEDGLGAELERLEALAESRSRAELEAAYDSVRELADSRPQLAEPQLLAATIAYRLSRWEDVVSYARRAGEPQAPDRQFYLAVALYEAGDPSAAREMMERCLPSLEPTDFVRGYAEKILAGG